MQRVHVDLFAGRIALPPRHFHHLEHGEFGVMPGSLASTQALSPGLFGAKLISLFPDNRQRGLPTIQGYILLFDGRDGTPLALVDAASITGLRTAAASAAATQALALPHANSLALLGYGVQALSHLQAVACIRRLEQVTVWGPTFAKADDFAQRATALTGLPVRACITVADTLAEADIVCTVTAAQEPIMQADWIQPGCHINLVGAHNAHTREADSATVARSRVYTEQTEFARVEAGDLILASQDSEFDFTQIIGEIGGVYQGDVPGRISDSDITLYKSLGNTAQDLIAAEAVFRA